MWRRFAGLATAVLALAVAAVVAMALAGCAGTMRQDGGRVVALVQVERSPEAERAGGAATPPGAPRAAGSFEDGLIRFRTRVTPNSVGFRLVNRAPAPMTIVWDDAELIDQNGVARRVINRHQELRSHEHRPPPDVVAAGAEHADDAVPVVEMEAPGGEVFQAVRIFSPEYDPIGLRIALRLPLEVGGVRYVYTFWYRVVEPRPDA